MVQKNVYVAWSLELREEREVKGYHINFGNNYGRNVMVLVNVERMNKTFEGVKGEHLDPMVETLTNIFEEMESVTTIR